MENWERYDIIFTIDYNVPNKAVINGGQNPYTEIYLYDNVYSLKGIDTIPEEGQKVSQFVFEEYQLPQFFVVKNQHNRYAKGKVFNSWWAGPYYCCTDSESDYNYYRVYHLLEYYYYQDEEPDFTEH